MKVDFEINFGTAFTETIPKVPPHPIYTAIGQKNPKTWNKTFQSLKIFQAFNVF